MQQNMLAMYLFQRKFVDNIRKLIGEGLCGVPDRGMTF